MPGYDLDILVRRDSEDGYKVTRKLADQVRQKFIILLMTIPGERLMNVNFGVGLSTYLFESFAAGNDVTTSTLTNAIMDQTRRYMPYISVEDIEFGREQTDEAFMEMRIIYSIPVLDDVIDPETGSHTLDFRAVNGDVQINWNSPESGSINAGGTYRRLL